MDFAGRLLTVMAVLVGMVISPESAPGSDSIPPVSTFSIVGFDPETGELGVAVQSKFFGVGSVVPFARAGVGAIATQSYANTTYGPRGLALLEQGLSPEEVVIKLTREDKDREKRQLGIVDPYGRAAAFTGKECNGYAGHSAQPSFSVQGNLLASDAVVTAMEKAYVAAQSDLASGLADWLLAALQAAQVEGGDKRGKQSAALLVVRDKGGYGGYSDRFIDLRVDDHRDPIEELARLLDLHKRFYATGHHYKERYSEGQLGPWSPVFDDSGESLKAWTVTQWSDVGKPADEGVTWTLESGVLHGSQTRGTWLVSPRDYANFVIQFDWKLEGRGNSGFGFWFPPQGDPAFEGIELQMVDPRYYPPAERVGADQLTGALYLGAAPERSNYRVEEWNRYRLQAIGSQVEVDLNGERVLSLNLNEFSAPVKRHSGESAPPLKDRPRRGRIGFQELSREGGHVKIRNILIQEF